MAPGRPLEPFRYERRDLADHEVDVTVTHCALCGDDVHMIDNDWGCTTYPFVPGHEIVGIIRETGERVTRVAPGERVGVGRQARSCGECAWCRAGREDCCVDLAACLTWVPYGGFAEHVTVSEGFVVPLPEAVDSCRAAPLLCAGAAAYQSVTEHARPASRVGVVGIGGLGHLVVQFARGIGCDVTAFSTSSDKEQDVREWGAQEVVPASDPDAMRRRTRSLDLVIYAGRGCADWEGLIRMLVPEGTLCVLGSAETPILFQRPAASLSSLRVISGCPAPPAALPEMLGFVEAHGIDVRVETLPMAEANRALAKLRANRARYRVVLAV